MIRENLQALQAQIPSGVQLVAVSKFHPLENILEAYDAGQRIFAESRPQELAEKVSQLDISKYPGLEWHFIGHLQTNKLKKVLPYVAMVESVDSVHLLEAISRWGIEHGRCIDILLEMHLGAEETKQGFSEEEIAAIVAGRAAYPGVTVRGRMGMATNTPDERVVRSDFARIAALWRRLRASEPLALPDSSEPTSAHSDASEPALRPGASAPADCPASAAPKARLGFAEPALADSFTELSIGMSADWPLALEAGSTLVRIGTAIFGERL